MIEFRGLSKKFGEKVAVNSLDFSVPTGALFGFLGPNGAGKTTSLRILMGLLPPSSGVATIDGFDVTKDSLQVRSRVGYLPDDVFLYDYLTGQQFLEFVADIRGIPQDLACEKIENYLEFFKLDQVAGDYTANYSFGMKKKLALAGIVLHDPKVLLLDEPFNGLDPQAVKDFRELLVERVKVGTTVLFSSHVLEVVEKLVTDVGIIHEGSLRMVSPLPDLLAKFDGSLEKAFFACSQKIVD